MRLGLDPKEFSRASPPMRSTRAEARLVTSDESKRKVQARQKGRQSF